MGAEEHTLVVLTLGEAIFFEGQFREQTAGG